MDNLAGSPVPSHSDDRVGCAERVPSFHVVPGSLRLEDFWSYFRPTENRDARTVREGLEFLRERRRDVFSRWLKRHYDYVIVDCPPAIAWQVRFFLLAADGYVVPFASPSEGITWQKTSSSFDV